MKPIGKHKHLWYCVECGTLIRGGGHHVIRWFYVCTMECREKWLKRPEKERDTIIKAHVKGNTNG